MITIKLSYQNEPILITLYEFKGKNLNDMEDYWNNFIYNIISTEIIIHHEFEKKFPYIIFQAKMKTTNQIVKIAINEKDNISSNINLKYKGIEVSFSEFLEIFKEETIKMNCVESEKEVNEKLLKKNTVYFIVENLESKYIHISYGDKTICGKDSMGYFLIEKNTDSIKENIYQTIDKIETKFMDPEIEKKTELQWCQSFYTKYLEELNNDNSQ